MYYCRLILTSFLFFLPIMLISGQKKQKVKPNIVVIIADDVGWNDFSFNGADQIPTPNIDALAYNGVILNRHYALPVCTPSRAAFMTGRYPIRMGLQNMPLHCGERKAIPLNETLIPEHFKRLGYDTKLVGKWHLGFYSDKQTPSRRGFDSFFGYYNGFISYFGHTSTEILDDGQVFRGNDLHRDDQNSLNATYSDKYFTDLITDEVESIIKSRKKGDNPLFLEMTHLAGHSGEIYEELLEVRDLNEVNEQFHYIKDVNRRKYAGMISALDESVGRVVKALNDAQILDNTIIVFMSDNGAPTIAERLNYGSNYPFRGIKFQLHEGGIRVPALIFSPLIKKHSRVAKGTMHIVDWLPTLYRAAGGKVEELGEIDGLDHWKSLVEAEKSPRNNFTLLNIMDYIHHRESGILGKFKLLRGDFKYQSDFYGDTGNDPTYPPYSAANILSSPANQAIGHLNEYDQPSIAKIRKLREKSRVKCSVPNDYPVCTDICLFNIEKDPCETVNIARKHPEMVKKIGSMIDEYKKVLMAPKPGPPIDVLSNPAKFGGNWMPWLNCNTTEC